MEQQNRLTSGSVFGTIVSFSLPYLLSYFLQTLYGMADLFIVGQFGTVADITAVSIGSQVTHMLTVMIVGLAMGATVLIGQSVGAGDRKKTSTAVGNTVTLFMGLSLVTTVVLVLLVRPIVQVMSTPREAVEGMVSYLTICFMGIPFITAYNVISSIFRGIGDSRSPMYFIGIACIVNIIFDVILIGGMGMGPSGAALGTVLAQTISVLISLWFVSRSRLGFRPSRGDFRPQRGIMKRILTIGIPVSLQDGVIQIAFILITIFANRRGLDSAAAVGVVEKMIGILFLVPSSLLSSISAIAAQNVGAGKHDRARLTLRYSCFIAVTWGILACTVMQFYSAPFLGLFTDSAEVVELGVQYMKGYAWDCIFAGIHFCFSGYFCAYGLSGVSFIHNLLSMACVRVPFSWYASTHFTDSLFPMGLASPAGSMLSIIICVSVYIWMRHRDKAAMTEESR